MPRRIQARKPGTPKRRPRKVAFRNPRGLASTVKRLALSSCETKQSTQYTSALQNLFHDRTYYAGQLLATTQGVTAPHGLNEAALNRIGDEVIGRGVKLKLFIEQEAERPNVMYMIYIYRYNVLLMNAGATPPAVMTDNEFWTGPAGAGALTNRMLDQPNSKNIKVIRRKVIKPVNQANYSIQTAGPTPVGPFVKTDYHEFWIPLKNKKIRYRNPDSPLPERDGLGFALVAFDAQNTATTDHISNVMWTSTFYFKDP